MDCIPELMTALRIARADGVLAKSSVVAQEASELSNRWKIEVQKREQMDAELRAILDGMRTLHGVSNWFGKEQHSVAQLQKALSRCMISTQLRPINEVSSRLRNVALTMKDYILDCKHKRLRAEHSLENMLNKLEHVPCRITPTSIATLKKNLDEANLFVEGVVSPYLPRQGDTCNDVTVNASSSGADNSENGNKNSENGTSTLVRENIQLRNLGRSSILQSVEVDDTHIVKNACNNNTYSINMKIDPFTLLDWSAVINARKRTAPIFEIFSKVKSSMESMERALNKAILTCVKKFSEIHDESHSSQLSCEVIKISDFDVSPGANTALKVDIIQLKTVAIEDSRVFKVVDKAVRVSDDALRESSKVVVEVRDCISCLQAILDDYDVDVHRRRAVEELLQLRARVKDFFDRELRLAEGDPATRQRVLRDAQQRHERFQVRLMKFVAHGKTNKVIDLVVKYSVNVNGLVKKRRHSRGVLDKDNNNTNDAIDVIDNDTSDMQTMETITSAGMILYHELPLLTAIRTDNPAMVKTLIELGGDPQMPGLVTLTDKECGKTCSNSTRCHGRENENETSTLSDRSTSKTHGGRHLSSKKMRHSDNFRQHTNHSMNRHKRTRNKINRHINSSSAHLVNSMQYLSTPLLLAASLPRLRNGTQIINLLTSQMPIQSPLGSKIAIETLSGITSHATNVSSQASFDSTKTARGASIHSHGVHRKALLNGTLPQGNHEPPGASAVTPLIAALHLGNNDIASILLERKADIDTAFRDVDGMTALHLAARNSDIIVLKSICEKLKVAARQIQSSLKDDTLQMTAQAAAACMQATHNGGWMPLHFAVFSGNTDRVSAILDALLELNNVIPGFLQNVLSKTITKYKINGQLEIASPVNANNIDNHHNAKYGYHTGLDIAIFGGHIKIVNMLLAHKAPSGSIAMHMANIRGNASTPTNSSNTIVLEHQNVNTKHIEKSNIESDESNTGKDCKTKMTGDWKYDILSQPMPHNMPSVHLAAMLGDFKMLFVLFFSDERDDRANLKLGLDMQDHVKAVCAMHPFDFTVYNTEAFQEIVSDAYEDANFMRKAFRDVGLKLDRAAIGYLRLRHLRTWLVKNIPDVENTELEDLTESQLQLHASGSGLIDYYSQQMLGKLLNAYFFRIQKQLLNKHSGTSGGFMWSAKGNEAVLSLNEVNYPGADRVVHQKEEDEDSASTASVTSHSDASTMTLCTPALSVAVAGASDKDASLDLMLDDLQPIINDFHVDIDGFIDFCVHFTMLRCVLEGIHAELRLIAEEEEELKAQRKMDCESALLAAAADGNADELLDILSDSVDVSASNKNGKFQFDLEVCNSNDQTALMLATASGHSDAVDVLLKVKADPLFYREFDSRSVLVEACVADNTINNIFAIVLAAVQRACGDDQEMLLFHLNLMVSFSQHTNVVNEPLVLIATRLHKPGVLKTMLQALVKATSSTNTKEGENYSKNLGAELLNLMCGDEFDEDDDTCSVGSRVSKPATVLWMALNQICHSLLNIQTEEEDAFVGLPSLLDPFGEMVLPDNDAFDVMACAEQLLHCPGIDINNRGGLTNATPLEIAIANGVEPVAIKLLQAKCSPNGFDLPESGDTLVFVHTGNPLMNSVLNNDLMMVMVLLKQPAIYLNIVLAPSNADIKQDTYCSIDTNLSKRDDLIDALAGCNVLHVAAHMGYFSIMNLLLRHSDSYQLHMDMARTPKVLKQQCADGQQRLLFVELSEESEDEQGVKESVVKIEQGGLTYKDIVREKWEVPLETVIEEGNTDASELIIELEDQLLNRKVDELFDSFDEANVGRINEKCLKYIMKDCGAAIALGLVNFNERLSDFLEDRVTLNGKYDFDSVLTVAREFHQEVKQHRKHGLLEYWKGGTGTYTEGKNGFMTSMDGGKVLEDQQQLLFEAIERGDLDFVKQWTASLENKPREDSINTLKNTVDNSGYNSLMVAIYFVQLEVARELVKIAISILPSSSDSPMNTNKTAAGGIGNINQEVFSVTDFINHQGHDGCTALVIAAAGGDSDAVLEILNLDCCYSKQTQSICESDNGPFLDLDLATRSGATAVYTATIEHHIDIVRLLLDANANPNPPTSASAFSSDSEVCAPLLAAVEDEHLSLVELLLSYGVNPSSTETRIHKSIGSLIQKKYTGELKENIENDTNHVKEEVTQTAVSSVLDINIVGHGGRTPLMTSILLGNAAIVAALLHAGALNHKVIDNNVNTSKLSEAMVAVIMGDQAVLTKLIDAGVDMNFTTSNGETLEVFVMKLHSMSLQEFLDVDLEAEAVYANCQTEAEVMQLAKEEFAAMERIGTGKSEAGTIRAYIDSYVFPIDGKDVTARNFYHHDLYSVLIDGLSLRLTRCWTCVMEKELQHAQLTFYKRMMCLIALWEFYSATDRIGGDVDEIRDALFLACEQNDFEKVVRAATHHHINLKADINEHGESALRVSVFIVSKLYKTMRNKASMESNPVHLKEWEHNPKKLQNLTAVPMALLKLKADINQPSADGLTPLMLACEFGNEPLIKKILHSSGQWTDPFPNIDRVDSSSDMSGHLQLDFRVELDVVDSNTGHTALDLAVKGLYPDIVRLLLRAGARVVVGELNIVVTAMMMLQKALSALKALPDTAIEINRNEAAKKVSVAKEIVSILHSHPAARRSSAKLCQPFILWHLLISKSRSSKAAVAKAIENFAKPIKQVMDHVDWHFLQKQDAALANKWIGTRKQKSNINNGKEDILNQDEIIFKTADEKMILEQGKTKVRFFKDLTMNMETARMGTFIKFSEASPDTHALLLDDKSDKEVECELGLLLPQDMIAGTIIDMDTNALPPDECKILIHSDEYEDIQVPFIVFDYYRHLDNTEVYV